ncbi:MAG: VCBS repeat-containing protein, partial [Acidobacteria bacterium]|nr:VCBS repeat-containing protein [Acidobacteriota bacterium]
MNTTSPSASLRGRLFAALAIFLCLMSVSARLAVARAVLDFDGDGKTDYAVDAINSDDHKIFWYVAQSSGGVLAQQFGVSDLNAGLYDLIIPEDYDGDGKCDIAVFRRGAPLMLYVLASRTNTFQATPFSGYNNLNLTQDFDGDGQADPTEAYYELGSPNLIWRTLESRTGNLRRVHFGNFYTDRPLKGDFDGDGRADLAVYRNHTGTPANTFFVLRSSDGGIQAQTFGTAQTDYTIDSSDFDGDGKTDFAVRRSYGTGTNGNWYWIESSTGAYRSLSFGT